MKTPDPAVTQPARLPAILLFGMPGVGKGTQGVLLGTMKGVLHVSTGAIFRGLDPATADGQEVGKFIHHGELVPDELCIRIWRHWLDEKISNGTYNPARQVLLLDGIPRSVRQCEMLQDHIEVLTIVHLETDDIEPIVQRLRSRALVAGRADDADEKIIRRRFEIYRQTTQPVLNFYPAELSHSVNPMGTEMQVKKRILDVIIPTIRDAGYGVVADSAT